MEKIKKFSDLQAWQEAHKLALLVYEYTKSFLKEELFGLVSQMRRAPVSVTSNIAEGFARRSSKEKTHFYYTSIASLNELQSQMMIARDTKMINVEKHEEFHKQSDQTSRLLRGLIKSQQSQ